MFLDLRNISVVNDSTKDFLTVMKVCIVISYFLLVVVLATLAAIHSKSAGICLILISLIPFLYILLKFGVINLTISNRMQKFMVISFGVLAVLCGVTG